MAYAKHTLGDILLSLSYRYGESAIPATGIDNRKYWINRGVEFCVDQLKMKKTASVTVVDGTANLSSAGKYAGRMPRSSSPPVNFPEPVW